MSPCADALACAPPLAAFAGELLVTLFAAMTATKIQSACCRGGCSKGRTRIFRAALRARVALYLCASDFHAVSQGARTAVTGKLCRMTHRKLPCG
jgi:hypothetical protein